MNIWKITRYICLLIALLTISFSALPVQEAKAYPKPKLVPPGWELNFFYDTPRILIHRSPGDDEAKRYLYMTYRVVNRTGEDVNFFPRISMITGTGELRNAGQNLGADVFEQVRFETRIPMLQTNAQMQGQLNQGRDNTKYGAAIFLLPDKDVDSFTIFVSGLSEEAQSVTPPGGDTAEVMLKTMMLSFEAPGDNKTLNMNLKPIKNTDERWIMK